MFACEPLGCGAVRCTRYARAPKQILPLKRCAREEGSAEDLPQTTSVRVSHLTRTKAVVRHTRTMGRSPVIHLGCRSVSRPGRVSIWLSDWNTKDLNLLKDAQDVDGSLLVRAVRRAYQIKRACVSACVRRIEWIKQVLQVIVVQ